MQKKFSDILGEKTLKNENQEIRAWLMDIAGVYDWNQMIFGPCPKSALWHDKKSQLKRFKVFSKIFDKEDKKNQNIFINDFGCGYGAFFEYIKNKKEIKNGKYFGYDISRKMVDEASKIHKDDRAQFFFSDIPFYKADYSFASGTFGFKPDIKDEKWKEYVKSLVLEMAKKSKKAIGFNMLDINAPKDIKKEGLFYADPLEFEEYCKKNISKDTKIIKGYIPIDWTIFVRF
jgi:SAM-dependent methyltransferase